MHLPEPRKPRRAPGVPDSSFAQATLAQLRERLYGSGALVVSGDQVVLNLEVPAGGRRVERWRKQRGTADTFELLEASDG